MRRLLFALLVFCAGGTHAQQPVARQFMVAAAHPLAVEAGYDVLKQGGSAVDAAIAVQMVLGLVEPESSGIGGGAFVLHWNARSRKLVSYDGRETAPAAARPDRFLDAQKKPLAFFDAAVSGRSVGVPGVFRVLELAHRRHGKLPWATLFQPAITLAENGFAMSPRLHAQAARDPYLRNDPKARAVYYDVDGNTRAAGSIVKNQAYARTLRTIAAEGANAFYSGAIASDIVQAVRAHAKPGDLAEEDLARYRAVEREPLCGEHRGERLCSMGPPSSGGVAVLQILAILERARYASVAPRSEESVHLFAEAARLAYADRARYLGDPDFVAVPVAKLLDPAYLDRRAALISGRSMKLAPPGDPESGTSHLSVLDREGNVVAMTTTVESAFGSRIMVRGFLLNNELTDFDFVPGGANAPGPGKRPRSSMAPFIVFGRDGEARMALGSPGGSMIISYVAKTLAAALDWGLPLQEAVELPNIGSRNGPTLIERGSAFEALRPQLERRGHEVQFLELTSGIYGFERVPGGWRGAADPRREGVARGD